jgi:hypothetical protein
MEPGMDTEAIAAPRIVAVTFTAAATAAGAAAVAATDGIADVSTAVQADWDTAFSLQRYPGTAIRTGGAARPTTTRTITIISGTVAPGRMRPCSRRPASLIKCRRRRRRYANCSSSLRRASRTSNSRAIAKTVGGSRRRKSVLIRERRPPVRRGLRQCHLRIPRQRGLLNTFEPTGRVSWLATIAWSSASASALPVSTLCRPSRG